MDYVRSSDIVKRLKLELPLQLTMTDPNTQQPITVDRENIHAMLVLDTSNLVFEGQMIPALYAELGRYQRAAQYEASVAASEFASWKARKVKEYRKKNPKLAKDKAESEYRTEDDYQQMATAPERWKAIAGLLEDCRDAVRIKSYMASDQAKLMMGHEQTMRHSDTIDRIEDYAAHAAQVGQIIGDDGSAQQMRELSGKTADNSSKKPRSL